VSMIGLSCNRMRLICFSFGMCIIELNCVKKVRSEEIHVDDTYGIEWVASKGEVVIPAKTIKDSKRIII
jgi:hypothetical protein